MGEALLNLQERFYLNIGLEEAIGKYPSVAALDEDIAALNNLEPEDIIAFTGEGLDRKRETLHFLASCILNGDLAPVTLKGISADQLAVLADAVEVSSCTVIPSVYQLCARLSAELLQASLELSGDLAGLNAEMTDMLREYDTAEIEKISQLSVDDGDLEPNN